MHPFFVLDSRNGLTRTPTHPPPSCLRQAPATRINAEIMRKDFEKIFSHLKAVEPPAGLFERILLAIKQEQEQRNSKRLAFEFLALLILSISAMPFSWAFFSGQLAESGILQFASIALNDFRTFLSLWPDSILAVAESLPIMGITLFAINMILAVFTLRLFLYKKRLLVGYLLPSSNLNTAAPNRFLWRKF